MKKKLLLLSFIEGAAVMAAELCGAKLLAPIFGSSLFVWSSVMGITLAALAGGYFYGGYLTQKVNDKQKLLFQLLSIAALCVLAMPVLSHYLLPRISYLPFLLGVVIGTSTLIFFPVFFLGTTSPVFIAIQSVNPGEEGKVSGTVYAISTAGGIFATFVCGFYVIPNLGLTSCLLLFGGVLFITTLLISKSIKLGNLFFLAAIFYLTIQFKIKKGSDLYSEDGIYGNLKVQDIRYNDSLTVRYLKTNDIPQTEMDLNSHHPISLYMTLLDSLIPVAESKKNALLLGLGGGLLGNVLIQKNYSTDAVEIDDRIIDIARQYFYLDKKVNTFRQDARYFLNKTKKKYDVVVIDLYRAEEPPSHVLTKESLNHLKQNLNKDAIVYINWHGYLNGNIGKGTAILVNTFIQSGFNVKLCSGSNDEAHRNLIFVASLTALKKMQFELNESPMSTPLINTDNKPLLEKYNALANKTWRLNYLRYYQGLKVN